MPFVEGFILGLGMIVFVGPVFIQLITVSIQSGIRSGIFLAIGIFVSDILCVFLCRYGNSYLKLNKENQIFLSVAGGLLLFLLGMKTLFMKKDSLVLAQKQNEWDRIAAFTKGFLVNFVNPFVFLVWLGVTAYSKNHYTSNLNEMIYLSGVLLAILSMDVAKVFLSKQIGNLLRADSHHWIYKISGLCLIGFSIRLLIAIFDN